MTQNTPGPWKAATEVRGGLVGFIVSAETPEGPAVMSEAFPRPYLVAINAANADLIAAAPDLLAALEEIDALACRTVGGNHPEDLPESAPMDNEHVVSICRAAIAKARGER